jgi:hypothetical protein
MEKQQRNKLIVGIGFIALITGISVWAYITILVPNRDYHKRTGKKYSQKIQYKTTYNPDYIDSLVRATQEALNKKK